MVTAGFANDVDGCEPVRADDVGRDRERRRRGPRAHASPNDSEQTERRDELTDDQWCAAAIVMRREEQR